jgi:hypothetical protein
MRRQSAPEFHRFACTCLLGFLLHTGQARSLSDVEQLPAEVRTNGWIAFARIDIHTGNPSPIHTVDCCSPDGFPDSQSVIFSWRPPGQKQNNGQGWTQLWAADSHGRRRHLIFGEDGRHIYGGHVSPDGKYVLFTGNPREDGDPVRKGAPMGLIRLSDAPIMGGQRPELRALHPQARSGPVLQLPMGFEPCWTASECSGLENGEP